MTLSIKSAFSRLHKSTWIVLAIGVVAFVLVNVPGQSATSVDLSGEGQSGLEFRHHPFYSHGWPFSYLERQTYLPAVTLPAVSPPGTTSSGFPRHSSPWELFRGVTYFQPGWLLLDAALACVGLAIAAVAFERWRSRHHRLLQFNLLDGFAFVTVLACTLGYLTLELRRSADEQNVLREMERGDEQLRQNRQFQVGYKLRGPFWLRDLMGKRYPRWFDRVSRITVDGDGLRYLPRFRDLEIVEIVGEASNEQLRGLEQLPNLVALDMKFVTLPVNESDDESESESKRESICLPALPNLRALAIHSTEFRGQGLSGLSQLEVLDLSETAIGDESLAAVAHCQRLRKLCLYDSEITNGGLRHLRSLNQLEELVLPQWVIDSDGLRCLASLSKLAALHVSLSASDDDISTLQQFPSLKYLELSTHYRLDDLRGALPNCDVESWGAQ